MLISLVHRTKFAYVGKARDSFNEVHLKPLDDAGQICRSFELRTNPASQAREYVDFYGNTVHYFDVVAEHSSLLIEAISEVETTPDAARSKVPEVMMPAPESNQEIEMNAEFLSGSHYVELDVDLWKEAKDALSSGPADVWTNVQRIGHHIYKNFAYKPKSTGVGTRASDALKLRSGVCQDFAHVALGLCRCSGIPARYVSGYFINTSRREGEDEASHAWIEAYIPTFGWASFDPTHDRPADERYIKAATGRDYADIRPVSGTYRGGKTRSLKVEVEVRAAQPARVDC